jgi:hypothetical protein
MRSLMILVNNFVKKKKKVMDLLLEISIKILDY